MADKPPFDPFTDLLTHLVRVPKEAIDAEQKREDTNKARRKNRKQAKPGQIVPAVGAKKAG